MGTINDDMYFNVFEGLSRSPDLKPTVEGMMCGPDNQLKGLSRGPCMGLSRGPYVFLGDCRWRDLSGWEFAVDDLRHIICGLVEDKDDCIERLKCALDSVAWANKPSSSVGSFTKG